jgi:dTDP-4-amino-4,6-dideoxygalactose transaminase
MDQEQRILAGTVTMKIPFTNLFQQYLDCKTEIDEAIAHVIATSSFITGPDVTRFELEFAAYVGAEDCASTGSGTTALICALRALGIGKGDEVITTPHTFVATTEAIVSVGATPIFVDIDQDTHLIDLDLVEKAITPHTAAIMFVDIYGQCPNMQRLSAIRDKYDLYLIEDAAHSLGNSFMEHTVGSFADITCFSFNPVKNLGAMGDAGCAVGEKILMDKVRMYRDHGRIGRYDIVEIGYNARIDNMQSNIILAKLPKLKKWLERKRNICAYYDSKLYEIVKPVKIEPGNSHSRYVYVIQTPHRNELKEFLINRGIDTSIHYSTTTHQQVAYLPWYRPCPIAEKTVNEILSLPCWPSMNDIEVNYVVNCIEEFFKND